MVGITLSDEIEFKRNELIGKEDFVESEQTTEIGIAV